MQLFLLKDLLYSIWASEIDVASFVCLRVVEIGGLDFLPYHGRCCRLPSSRYATKTDSWGGGKCFRTISWGRRSMRCYTRYSSSTLVQGHIPTRDCLCDSQNCTSFHHETTRPVVTGYRVDHAIHTRLYEMDWWTWNDSGRRDC